MKKMVGLVGVGVGSYAAATYLGATWGSTLEERARVLPTDDLVPDPMVVTNHAITIRGGAEDVWPWLVQVGWHKFPATEIRRMLQKRDRRVAGMTAPAHGLVLWKVFYSTPRRQDAKTRSRTAGQNKIM